MFSSLVIAVDLDMRSSVRLVMPDEVVDGVGAEGGEEFAGGFAGEAEGFPGHVESLVLRRM